VGSTRCCGAFIATVKKGAAPVANAHLRGRRASGPGQRAAPLICAPDMRECKALAQAMRTRNVPPHHSLWIDTMNRCFPAPRRTALLTLALLAFGLSPLAHAQNQPRIFPAKALRGTLVVTQPPLISMDGKATQLSPGARIRGTNNMLLLSGSLVNQPMTVNYTLEAHGMVHDVWVLTEAEAAEKRHTAASAAAAAN
jgi:hypothetical protein